MVRSSEDGWWLLKSNWEEVRFEKQIQWQKKTWNDVADRTLIVGRLFQVLAVAMVNARSDILVVVVGFDNTLAADDRSGVWTGWCVIMEQIV